MKQLLVIIFICAIYSTSYSQQEIRLDNGDVSFVTTRNVYVKFASTKDIQPGDTLYIGTADKLTPALVVDNKSSASTVCKPIGDQALEVGTTVYAKIIIVVEVPVEEEELVEESELEEPILSNAAPVITPDEKDPAEEVLFKEKIKGRFSVASYSNLSDFANRHRMRYAFRLRGYNINNSKWSTESYITFRHTLNDSIRLANALKVYSLNVQYEFDKSSRIILGRKINPKFSSLGAIDGIQYEKGWGRFSVGAVAGTRPDFRDYSFNPDLLQFGGYLSVGSTNPAKFAHTTIGLVEQMNKGATDRRFFYLQHSSTPAKGLHFFGSMEVDLYENINGEVKNSARLTNLYASLRYRFSNKFRVSASYDTRRNIIYYESYQNFIDQLIQDETRQGLRFGFTHRPFKKIIWGGNVGMRFQQSQQNPSRNASAYLTFQKVPFIKARATLRANFLQTDFIDSRIFSARMSKAFLRGKLSADIYYRWVDYSYKVGSRVLHQDIIGTSLSIRVRKNTSLHLFYEGVRDNQQQIYHRVNARVIKRF